MLKYMYTLAYQCSVVNDIAERGKFSEETIIDKL
jgi:hypothetical protein